MSTGDFIQAEDDLTRRNAWLENNREAVAPHLRNGRDCVIFTYSHQEPEDQATTRYGGLPYWSRRQPWPICRACSLVRPQPLQFVGQLDFRHPRTRSGVPGDVLVFHLCSSCWPNAADARDDEAAIVEAYRQRSGLLPLPNLPEGLRYSLHNGWSLTWQGGIAAEDLVAAAEIPIIPEAYSIGPFYGEAHEAKDYPTPREAYGGGIAGENYTYLQFTLQGTKIGGYRSPIQSTEDPVDATGQPMRFLAALGSLSSQRGGVRQASGQSDILWGDMGSVFLWLSDHTDPPEMTRFQESY